MSENKNKEPAQPDASGKQENLIQAPTINLPKGGGAIRGMGEKFTANPVTGTGSMSIPIATSPGRSGFGPQLSLSYDSGVGNGPFGLGWNLSLPSITRKTDKGLPRYFDMEESDVFILSGAEDLVPVLVKVEGQWKPEPLLDRTVDGKTYSIQRYRPRIEGLFARIERWTNTTDPSDIFWRSISKDNIVSVYGKEDESCIFDPDNPARIYSWLICETFDDKGNAIVYNYQKENGDNVDLTKAHELNRGNLDDHRRETNRYLKRIFYGNRNTFLDNSGQKPPFLPITFAATDTRPTKPDWMFEVVFDYEEGHIMSLPKNGEDREYINASASGSRAWQTRQDPFSSYRAGFEVRTYRLCRRVLMFHHFPNGTDDCLVRSTEFVYDETPIASFIKNVIQSGYLHQLPTTDKPETNRYLKKSLPALTFEYSPIPDTASLATLPIRVIQDEYLENLPIGLDGALYQWVDLDGEGMSGVLTEQASAWYYKRNLSPNHLEQPDRKGQSRATACFAPLKLVGQKPSVSIAGGAAQFMDLAGDGQLDVVVMDGPVKGFYERTDEGGWGSFRAFTSWPNIDTRDPNLRFVDLDGDGHADILITEDQVFTWYCSLAEAGFGTAKRASKSSDEENGPRLVFADETHSVFLADLSGDGLTDLVRITNGQVCYWPNLGYGRFGTKVTMDGSPRFDGNDQFDPLRIRLTDIDGTGPTDILYLHRDGVRLYFNQSGNRWSEAVELPQFPAPDNLASVQAMDLLGNGTACLVWSSPLPGDARQPMRYIDLMDGQKPHLLVSSKNNLGAETHIQYAPSTKFYLKDKEAGKPWITKLPFPVHVVERVETYDWISRSRFVTCYAYHHGYFDGVEREFRGFGMVEQRDTEEFTTLSDSDAFPVGDNIDEASHVPPIITKTWFHTGVFLLLNQISNFFAGLLNANDVGEYYREPGLDDTLAKALLLEDTVLPEGLSAEEQRQACRALKGTMLRQEVYALDGSDKEQHPYTVIEQNFTIESLQPQAGNRHSVFFTHPREVITYHYERENNHPDPRVQHALTLEVNSFGNVLKSAAIGYGRCFDAPDTAFLPEDHEKQKLIHITCTESSYTKPIVGKDDNYRTPLPAETSTYELRKPEQEKTSPGPIQLYDFAALLGHVNQAGDSNHDVNYEDILFDKAKQAAEENPEEGKLYFRRLIERVRTLYRPDDLGEANNDPNELLKLKEVGTLALPGESYRLAFTPGLLNQVYIRDGLPLLPPNVADVLQGGGTDHCGYVNLDGDGHWWIPSGRVFLSPKSTDTAALEHAYARSHFFLSHRYRDPFHTNTVKTETAVNYDTYDLLVLKTRDSLGNTITAEHDYRVLQPKLMTDPNGNRTEVKFDTLGMVAGTAEMGKVTETIGDSLDKFEPDLTKQQLKDFMADPKGQAALRLGTATTRIINDLDRYANSQQPVFAATLARETHLSAPLPPDGLKIQLSFSYSDGFGREIQKKIQAEPERLPDGSLSISPRWVGRGWIICNNKGKPVRQYEPFFDDTHDFKFGRKVGVSPILFYDPAERVIATLHPNHTYEKVVFDPWQQTTYDVNDTLRQADAQGKAFNPKDDPNVGQYFQRLPSDDYLPTWYGLRIDPANAAEFQKQYPDAVAPAQQTDAAQKAVAHADTPTTAHFDALGRPFLTVVRNRVVCKDHPLDGKPDEEFRTRVDLDIEGNQRQVMDERKLPDAQNLPLGGLEQRIVMSYDYDMLGNRIHQSSMEAGARWMLNDVAEKPIRAWDSRGHDFTTGYDPLRRPLTQSVRGRTADSDPRTKNADPTQSLLIDKIEYGEPPLNATVDQETQAQRLNLRTRVYRHYDSAGVTTNARLNSDGPIEAYDFKGNLLHSTRQLASDYKAIPDWSQPPEPQLDKEFFEASTRYDALNRPITLNAPDNSVIHHVYNEANLLNAVEANLCGGQKDGQPVWTPFVTNIDYDAKGQRQRIDYGNGASTFYGYDPLTFRLVHLITSRNAAVFPEDCPKTPPDGWLGCQVQNLRYTYDPAGNITHIQDDAQQTIFFRNKCVEPNADYTYDAIYRLIEATGREHLGQVGGSPIPHSCNDSPRVGIDWSANNGQAMGTYTERYVYDSVGNFLEMQHDRTDPQVTGWTRSYVYNEDSQLGSGKSNRLTSTTVGAMTETYSTGGDGYDAHGNMLSLPHLSLMAWDFKDQLWTTARQVVNNGGDAETTYYVYDAAGQRVRKVTVLATGVIKDERVYLGGFEIYRSHTGTDAGLVRETLHIMDDKQRIALVESRNEINDGSPPQLIRYQFSNHLGSASLELGGKAQIISYEEYTPYGSTSYQAVDKNLKAAAKRYRYTGKERDEESGFYYHGARYYVPWLGRWTASDPAGIKDGSNLYLFTSCNPVRYKDPTGLADFEVTMPTFRGQAGLQNADKLIEQTFKSGIAPKGGLTAPQTLENLLESINVSSAKSGFVQSSQSVDVAMGFASGSGSRGGVVFEILPKPDSIPVNWTSIADKIAYPEQRIVAHPGGVAPEQVVRAFKIIKGAKDVLEVVENPNSILAAPLPPPTAQPVEPMVPATEPAPTSATATKSIPVAEPAPVASAPKTPTNATASALATATEKAKSALTTTGKKVAGWAMEWGPKASKVLQLGTIVVGAFNAANEVKASTGDSAGGALAWLGGLAGGAIDDAMIGVDAAITGGGSYTPCAMHTFEQRGMSPVQATIADALVTFDKWSRNMLSR